MFIWVELALRSGDKVSCSRTQRTFSGEARARHLSILCRAPMSRFAPHEIVLSSYAYLVRFSNKMLVFRVDIHKMLVRIANREYPDLGLPCLSIPFWQTTGVRNI